MTVQRIVLRRLGDHKALAVVFVILVLWELIGMASGSRILSRPSEVVAASSLYLADGELFYHARVTLLAVTSGVLIAIVVGTPIGMVLGASQRLYVFTDWVIMALNATPRSALVPLIAFWFGVGLYGKSFIAFLTAVFPIMINVATGVRELPRPLHALAASFGATPFQFASKILAPATLPHLLGATRLAISWAMTAVILSEMYVSIAGLGRLMITAGASLRSDALFFLAIFTGLLGYGLIRGVYALERRWVPSVQRP